MALVPAFYAVPHPSKGQLYMGPKPSAETLDRDIAHITEMGVDCLVSMLEPTEASALGLGAEAEAAVAAGLEFRAVPVPDLGLPDRWPFIRLVNDLALAVHFGTNAAVHCHAGIGRSGMVAVGVLMRLGASFDKAVSVVTDARGVSVPETAEQRAFLASLAVDYSPRAAAMAGKKVSSIT